MALLPLLWLTLGAAPSLGSPLRQDGYSLRPPQGLRMARLDLFRGTRALAVGEAALEGRWLSAALIDADGDDSAAMVVSVVEGSFQATPSARDEFSTQLVRHFSEELGLKLAMERAELWGAPSPRIEVLGTVRQENQVRRVLVAAMEGEGRHVLVSFSSPTGRWEELAPSVRASLESFRNETPGASDTSRLLAAAATVALAGALLASLLVWRKRSRVGLRP